MKKLLLTALSLTCATALSGCATVSPPVSSPMLVCPVLPPAPASVMRPVQSDFKSQMLNFLSDSPAGPTK